VDQLSIRQITSDARSQTDGVAARAFFDEAFMRGMLGDDPLVRMRGSHHLYSTEEWDDEAVHLAAYIGPVAAGLVRMSPVGACHVCHLDPSSPPDDPIARQEWDFEIACAAVHRGLPDHAWISRVAVEPQLQGAGIGGALMRAAIDAIGAHGPATVLLECLDVRESFYVGHAFTRVAQVVDPYADATYLMRRDVLASAGNSRGSENGGGETSGRFAGP
jgi:ribosomal protein S18 acetylase RimI-like enzyme